MSESLSSAATASSAMNAGTTAASTFTVFGFTINPLVISAMFVIFGLLFLFYKVQKSNKLDFTDMITKDGRAVSLTKVLQLVGGATATWIMIKLTITGGLTEAVLGIYLAYVGGIEGYSKFIAAKYQYNEGSVRDRYDYSDQYRRPPGRYGNRPDSYRSIENEGEGEDDPSLRPPKE